MLETAYMSQMQQAKEREMERYLCIEAFVPTPRTEWRKPRMERPDHTTVY
jgi:hypothetical protein